MPTPAVQSLSAAEPAATGGVPAVTNAMRILRYLQSEGNNPCTMSEIARALHINGSTCFNVLRTMVSGGLLGYDPLTKRYELGLVLVELANSVNGTGQVLRATMSRTRQLTKDLGLTSLVATHREGQGFVVIGRSESNTRQVRVTSSVGEVFEPNAAVLSKAYYAWCPETDFDRMVERYGLPAHSRNSITNIEAFKREIGAVRHRGYSTSLGEYMPEHNAVGTAVLDFHGRVCAIIVVTGFASQITPRTLPQIGTRLHRAAQEIMTEVRGKYPDDWRQLTGWRQI